MLLMHGENMKTDKLDLLDTKLSDRQIQNCRQAFRFVSPRALPSVYCLFLGK